MRSAEGPAPSRLGVMRTWIGVGVMGLVTIAVLGLRDGLSRVVLGAALVVCVAMLAAMVWLDRRDARNADRTSRQG